MSFKHSDVGGRGWGWRSGWDMCKYNVLLRNLSLRIYIYIFQHDGAWMPTSTYWGRWRAKIGGLWPSRENILIEHTGVGFAKAPFVNFSISKIFDLAKVHLKLFESHLYLTGATAAELRRHLPNINLIFSSQHMFWHCWKIRKITERGKLA